jgi:tripartite ATP-independent transporter DctM subunit
MSVTWAPVLRKVMAMDGVLAGLALVGMALIPMVEMVLRPLHGQGIDNASVLVQHLGLLVAMMGAVSAQRHGHLSSLALAVHSHPSVQMGLRAFSQMGGAFLSGMLCAASWTLVASEMDAAPALAYGLPLWWVQAFLPLGFGILAIKMGWQSGPTSYGRVLAAVAWPLLGGWLAWTLELQEIPLAAGGLLLLALLLTGTPIFAVLGGLGLLLLGHEGLPLASLALSHYQITVNPSLPALPLFTLAGLVLAKTQASQRLSRVFVSVLGDGPVGTVLAVALLCSCFTALTGGSGVTILALGGLLLPLLKSAGYPENKGMGLVTSASALGVLLAPSVPLIMFAIIARVPINSMFLAGIVPAVVMIIFLVILGGFLPSLRTPNQAQTPDVTTLTPANKLHFVTAAWHAKWELFAPLVAVGSLVSGLTTPTESAALTAVYAVATQVMAHKEMSWQQFGDCVNQTTQLIGGVMLIMGMALGLTNYLIDAGVPDLAIDWVQSMTQNKYVFLLALNVFLFFAGALMEIYAAIVVLVPLLLPLAVSYGIDPIHFGIIFLANLEMGFLCPPAGMNIYFASAVFKKPLREVVVSVAPAVAAIFLGTLVLSWLPLLVTGLPTLMQP